MTALSGKWKLNSANGKEIANDVEVTFEEDKIHYRYGNNYFGNYEVNGNDLKVGPLAGTRMFCPQDPPEGDVAEAFQTSTNWNISGNTLTLSSSTGPKAVLTKI